MSDSLKTKTIKGSFWSLFESLSTKGIQFVLGLIMARLLSPEEYGIVGMLAIFIAVAQGFVDSGFANALIRNNKRTELDFSTAFFFNIVVGTLVYGILFLISPFIADFYDTPILESLTKVICLNVFINSLGIVQRAKFTIEVNFKQQAKATTTSVFVTGLLGIYLAYTGWGVWALVIQSVSRNALNVALLWVLSKWVPKWQFSWQSFRTMFNYGYKLLLSAQLDIIYNNVRTLIIGKVYSAGDLGNYTRAKQFADFPSSNMTSIIGRVTFPILSSIQDNDTRLEHVYRKYLRLMVFLIFPLMVGLAAVAEPLVLLILTEKWAACIPLLQLLCFSMMWYPVHAINLNLLQVKGRSDLFLKLEIIKKIIGVSVLVITVPMGIIYMVAGGILTSVVCLAVNTHYTGKLLNLGFLIQMKDIIPTLSLSLIMGAAVYMSTYLLPLSNVYQLIIGIPLGMIVYLGIAYIFKMSELDELLKLIKLKKS